jgi:hypothetical protein
MAQITLLDIVKANGADSVVGLVDETVKAHPEMGLVPSRTIRGINYKTLVRTALGRTTGSFRDGNAGTVPVKATYENRLVETFILESIIRADRGVADAYEDGWQAYLTMEAQAALEGEMQALAAQFYYGRGTGGNASGNPGLIDAYDSTNMVVDAGGTTGATGSSAWLVCFGARDVQWVWGNAGQFSVGPNPPSLETVADANDPTKFYRAYVQTIYARPGLQVASTQSVVRIKKLTADSGKGLTDTLIADALRRFPVGKRPDAIFCSRRSRYQLQVSRAASITTSGNQRAGGAVANIADVPTEAMGIPLYATDAILDTEALTL